MVGIVLVSHVTAVAEGAAELARQMGGEGSRIEPAGGLDDGAIGTDADRVRAAIERVASPDGVLVLMDLGSALLSAEMAVEMLDSEAPVLLTAAPLIEGAVAAAAAARGGAGLEEVAAEARGALAMKESQLGGEPQPDSEAAVGAAQPRPDAEARVRLRNEIGLHARPAARVVELASRFDADLRLAKTAGPGPVSARSLTGLMTLSARLGDELVVSATGPQAGEAVAAFEELAGDGFGEGVVAEVAAPEDRGAILPEATPLTTKAPAAPPSGARLEGIAASPGLALAPIHRLDFDDAPVDRPAEAPAEERRRLDAGRAAAREAIAADRERVAAAGAVAEAAIFDAHLALLDDEALLAPAREEIERGATAEHAWRQAADEAASAYRRIDDPLLRERAADVEDVGRRVVDAIGGGDSGARPEEETIAVVADLTAATVAALDRELVRGVASARGAPTAHGSILARALGMPAVVALGEAVLGLKEGTMIFLDAEHDALEVDPPPEQLRSARARLGAARRRRETLLRHAHEAATTRDGTRIEVGANLGAAADVERVIEQGADGVGLLRTEFLYLGRPSLPTEEEQATTLEGIAAALEGRSLIVRTLDAGADKPLPGLSSEREDNPFLGRRGIRLALAEPEIFAAQLRAILRVAARYPLKVMFPMVAELAELQEALSALRLARAETGIEAPLEIGIMVEVPAAALMAERLAPHVDFFSIGTNDLAQYTMAAERGNERVASLLAGPHPATLKLVRETVAAARSQGRWTGVCGELAGDPAAAVLLIGLGARELSAAPALVPEVKAAIRAVSLEDASAAASRALDASDAQEARQEAAELL